MRLGELAFTSYIFNRIDSGSYQQLLNQVNNQPEIAIPEHRQHLLDWLRKWGMRNIAHAADEAFSEILHNWYGEHNHNLPDEKTYIWELNDESLQQIQASFENLRGRHINNGGRQNSFGSTGTAKIFFSLRPKALPMWDEKIQTHLRNENLINGASDSELYVSFIRHIRNTLIPDLRQQCMNAGFALLELPQHLDRNNDITVLKLIDEYFWITITKNILPPQIRILQRWINWL